MRLKLKKIVVNSQKRYYKVYDLHTLIVGSGAAGLATAVRLHANGIKDLLIVTEGLKMGTSINTGSDKQTYYKLSLCADDNDSPLEMAKTFFNGGAVHGDLALTEASLSARGFLHLVDLGVKFPQDAYGQFAGYKTDHDPRRRATSIGPYTSKQMCLSLIDEIKQRKIDVLEKNTVVKLLVVKENKKRRVVGAVSIDNKGKVSVFYASNVVYATGGPGGLYKTSVYPKVHTGAVGVALLEGAAARNLTESQYGLASIKFRWNVSGTYMQVVPRVISTDPDGKSNVCEFLKDYYKKSGDMHSAVFMKGYQWPFDTAKAIGGSSLIDILVYIETVIKGRRVFLDYMENSDGFELDDLSSEACEYLKNSGAYQDTPIDRLMHMNPGAYELYKDHGIDISQEYLEVAVCAQHNNGGLAANHWWESENITHFFPVGEVNGSHGVCRPGGSALNAGQVGAFRAAEFIAAKYSEVSINSEKYLKKTDRILNNIFEMIDKSQDPTNASWRDERKEIQERMTECGAHIRSLDQVEEGLKNAWRHYARLTTNASFCTSALHYKEIFRNIYLCFSQVVYLEAICFALTEGVGSRGSAMVLDKKGKKIHKDLDDKWKLMVEDESFRSKVLVSEFDGHTPVNNYWEDCRELPVGDMWFENVWADYRNGKIYNS
jgi:succinate dehydrogenase/fumarate reductase flavoprotein subunit